MEEPAHEEVTPPGDIDVAPLAAEVVTEEPLDAFETSVFEAIERIRNPRSSWAQAILLLVVSLLLFVALRLQDDPFLFTGMLVGALLFHEMGHYLGMRLFGYRNVRMFFIPFFGAAVSGQRTTAKSYQEAIVTLLGPAPGVLLAAALFAAACIPDVSREVRQDVIRAALLLGVLNGINLLPIVPLDGGRLMNQLLFSRNRFLEGVFQSLAALALLGYGLSQQNYIVLFLGVCLMMGVAPKFKTNTIACRLGSERGETLPSMDGPIPVADFRAILAEVRSLMPGLTTAKDVAGATFRIWESMHVQPPGVLATVALLTVYLLAVILSVPWVFLFFCAGNG